MSRWKYINIVSVPSFLITKTSTIDGRNVPQRSFGQYSCWKLLKTAQEPGLRKMKQRNETYLIWLQLVNLGELTLPDGR